jgi:hypothetical protein
VSESTERELDRRLEALQYLIQLGELDGDFALEKVLVLYVEYVKKWASTQYHDEKSMWALGKVRAMVDSLTEDSTLRTELRRVLEESSDDE